MHINSPFFEQTIATTLQSTERRNIFHFELLSNLHGMSNTNKLLRQKPKENILQAHLCPHSLLTEPGIINLFYISFTLRKTL